MCICPQQVCSGRNSTSCPSRSSSSTIALPVCGNRVSLKQVMKTEILIARSRPASPAEMVVPACPADAPDAQRAHPAPSIHASRETNHLVDLDVLVAFPVGDVIVEAGQLVASHHAVGGDEVLAEGARNPLVRLQRL